MLQGSASQPALSRREDAPSNHFTTATSQLSSLPCYPSDPSSEDTLLKTVEKLVRSAGVEAKKGNLKNAATALRRAYSFATKKAEAGMLLGRVARAGVSVQYCALLSRFGRHTLALKEGLNAAREAEEVWSILMHAAVARDKAFRRGETGLPKTKPWGTILQAPPPWMQRAVSVLIQAKQAVAVELEYSVSDAYASTQNPTEIEAVRDQLVPSLHAEAAELASRLLPEGHPVRRLAERTQAQATVRHHKLLRSSLYGGRPSTAPSCAAAMDDEGVHGDDAHIRPCSSPGVLGAAEVRPLVTEHFDLDDHWKPPELDDEVIYGAPSPSQPGGPGGSRPLSAASGASRGVSAPSRPSSAALSRPASAARIQQLEDQALIRPMWATWPVAQTDDDQRFEDSVNNMADTHDGAPRSQTLRCGGSKTPGKKSKPLHRDDEGPKLDIFSEWVNGHRPKGYKAKIAARLGSEAGFQELKRDMQLESFRFRKEELPSKSPEDLYENKLMYSPYGMKIAEKARHNKEPEKAVLADRPSSPAGRRAHKSTHDKMLSSVRHFKTELLESDPTADRSSAVQRGKFARNSRLGGHRATIFSGLRAAFRSSKPVEELQQESETSASDEASSHTASAGA